MFSFFRRSQVKLKEPWNKAKCEYEEAILRCYKWETVGLAICGFRKFSAFNFIRRLEGERKPFVDSFPDCSLKLWGVVHEESQTSRHVRCEVDIVHTTRAEEFAGIFYLTHLLADEKTHPLANDKKRPEDRAMELKVILHDPTSMLKATLIDSLRDAALSGFRFMHIALECPETSSEDCDKALADMPTLDYAPHRQILTVKMWPKIELQNAPKWARLSD
jgi:hypothetical protein